MATSIIYSSSTASSSHNHMCHQPNTNGASSAGSRDLVVHPRISLRMLAMLAFLTITSSFMSLTSAAIVYVSPSGNDGTGSGTSGSPFATIDHGLAIIGSTSTTPSDNTLQLLPGTYTGAGNVELDIRASLNAPQSVTQLTIACSSSSSPCIITAAGYQRFASLQCVDAIATAPYTCVNLTISGITIIGGSHARGGVMKMVNATVTILSSTIAMSPINCLWMSVTNLRIINSNVHDCGNLSLLANNAGGLWIDSDASYRSDIFIDNTLFQRCNASGSGGAYSGGAIASSGSGRVAPDYYYTLTVQQSQFDSNMGPAYGAAVMSINSAAIINVTNSIFTNNLAVLIDQGGSVIALSQSSITASFVGCTFKANIVPAPITSAAGSTLWDSCVFSNNIGSNVYYYTAGAIVFQFATAGPNLITRCIFSGNQAATSGIMLQASGFVASIIVQHSLFINNIGWQYGVFMIQAKGLVVRRCVFLNNVGAYTSIILFKAGTADISSSLIRGSRTPTQGAINVAHSDGTMVTFTNMIFDSNTATGYAAAFQLTLGISTWINCTFTNHTSTTASSTTGGGVGFSNFGVHQFFGCNFNNNQAIQGGAVMVTATAKITFNNTIFSNNRAITKGGALYLASTTSNPVTIVGCTFTSNSASGGGAIAADIMSAIITTSNFISNRGIVGGAISLSGNTMTIQGCAFTSNTAMDGGAVLYQAQGTLMVNTCMFQGNAAVNSGGVYTLVIIAGQVPQVDFINITATGNTAAVGGALALTGGVIRLTSSVLTANTAVATLASTIVDGSGSGGGVAVYAGSSLTVTSTVFDNNIAASMGGAINHATAGSSVNITMSTFTSNQATTGGAISFAGPFTATSTLFINNMASQGGAMYARVCPSPLLSHVQYINNSATKAGGALHWAYAVPVCSSICTPITSTSGILSPFTLANGDIFDCSFSGNAAVVGNDLSTEPHHLVAVTITAPIAAPTSSPTNDTTGLPSTISALDGSLTVQVRVLDYYGQLMASLDGITESILVTLTTAAGVTVNGRSSESAIGGIATFEGIKFAPSLVNPSSTTLLSIQAQPSLQSSIVTPLKLTDVVLANDHVAANYSGGTVVLALLVAVVGSWTSMIFIEEAIFHLQGKRKSHVPFSFVASVAFGLCGIWGAFVMEMGSLTIPSVAVSIRLTPNLALGIAPVAIILVWAAIELYVREFGGRAPRISKQKRVDMTYGTGIVDRATNPNANKDDDDDSSEEGTQNGTRTVAGGGTGERGSLLKDTTSGGGGTTAGTPVAAAANKSQSGDSKQQKSTSGDDMPANTADNNTAKPVKPKRVREYPPVVRMIFDIMVPRLLLANIIVTVLQVGMVLVLVSSIRWQLKLEFNSGTIIAAFVVGVIASHISFWLMFNLNVFRTICPFLVAGSSLIVFHILMAGNTYSYEPYNTWTDTTWPGDSYAIIISAITAVMCFLFIGIQFSRMQLSRNALHTILKKAKGQIIILDNQLAESRQETERSEKNASDLSRMLELIAYCGPSYTAHSLALSLSKDKKGHDKTKDVLSVLTAPSATVAALSAATNSADVKLPGYTPHQHSDSGIVTALERVDEAMKDTNRTNMVNASGKVDSANDIPLRDLLKNVVTLEIFKQFMITEHAAESLGLYLDIQRYKLLGSKESRAIIGARMVREYLEDKSAQEVNVSQVTRTQVLKEIAKKNWSHSLFEPVEKALYSLMNMDTRVRFKKTKEYAICSLLLTTYGASDTQVGTTATTHALTSAPMTVEAVSHSGGRPVTAHATTSVAGTPVNAAGGPAQHMLVSRHSNSGNGGVGGADKYRVNTGTPPPPSSRLVTSGTPKSTTPHLTPASSIPLTHTNLSTPTFVDPAATSPSPVGGAGGIPLSPVRDRGSHHALLPNTSTGAVSSYNTSSAHDVLPGIPTVTDI